MIKSLAIGTIFFLVVLGSQPCFSRSQEVYLTRSNYQWMLGNNLPLFDAAWDLTHNYGQQRTSEMERGSGDLGSLRTNVIRSVFAKHAPNRRIFSVQRMMATTQFRFDGWVITTADPTPVKIGIRNNVREDGSTCCTYITIGYSTESSDHEWFGRMWYSPRLMEPFKAVVVSSGDARSLNSLLIEGRHFDTQGRVIEEFQKQWATQGLQVVQRNPAPKSLEEIYSRDLPDGKSLTEIKSIAWDARRVPVVVFDSGVDYNHPQIAYKLCRKLLPEVRAKLQEELEENQRQTTFNESYYFAATRRRDELASLREQKASLERVLNTDGQGWDFVENENLPYDFGRSLFFGESISHGTAVADVAAGSGERTCVIPIRLLDNSDDQDFASKFEQAVWYSKLAGARVINMSYSGYDISEEDLRKMSKAFGASEEMIAFRLKEHKKVTASRQRIVEIMRANSHVTFVISSGNETESEMVKLNADLPAIMNHQQKNIRLPNVLFVASIKTDKTLSDFSVYGKNSVHLAAFGDSNTLPFKEGQSYEAQGTSFSAPFVANKLGNLLYNDRSATVQSLISQLQRSVIPTPHLEGKLIWGGYIQ